MARFLLDPLTDTVVHITTQMVVVSTNDEDLIEDEFAESIAHDWAPGELSKVAASREWDVYPA
jgi:hypothetical protein